MRVVVLADTHAPRRWRACPPRVAAELRGADLILHAGDVCTAVVLAELAQYAPVVAVLGNNDGPDVADWGAAPDRRARPGRAPRRDAARQRPGHRPAGADAPRVPRARTWWCSGIRTSRSIESGYGLRIFNPGSPTDRRRQPHGTLGVLQIADGRLAEATIVPVT